MPQVQQYQTTYPGVPANGGHGMAQEVMQELQLLLVDGGEDKCRDEDARGDSEVSRYGDAEHSEAQKTRTRRRFSRLQEQTTEGELWQVRTKKAALVSWPFMYSYKEDVCFVNAVPRKSTYATAEEVGYALL